MASELSAMLDECPIIAAVKNEAGLEQCLQSEIQLVFILYGSVCEIPAIVQQVKNAGRSAVVHVDLISGLSPSEAAVDFIRQYTRADGIISTRPQVLRRAKDLGLATVQRFFVIDSMALENVYKHQEDTRPDFIEMLPGAMPKILQKLSSSLPTPIIAGGLISDKEDVMAALKAGARAISTSNPEIWFM